MRIPKIVSMSLGMLTVSLISLHAHGANIRSKSLSVNFEGKTYLLDIYRSSQNKQNQLKRPGLVLVPDYFGKDELDAIQARRLAESGFVVLVLDLYGDGAHSTQGQVAAGLQHDAETPEIDNLLALISKGISVLKSEKDVDANKIGAVGFGYGGGLVWNLAKTGTESSLKAVVSFYGGTKKLAPINAAAKNLPAFLYVRPEEDIYTTADDFADFEKELKGSKLDFQFFRLPNIYHGFIHRTIANYGTDTGKTFMYYDAKAAETAWKKTVQFLNEKFVSK